MAGRSVFDRSRPTFRPITSGVLTDEEKRRLERIKTMYPFLEYTDARGMARLWFLRWYWRNGDER